MICQSVLWMDGTGQGVFYQPVSFDLGSVPLFSTHALYAEYLGM
jgi:hypothetical protein